VNRASGATHAQNSIANAANTQTTFVKSLDDYEENYSTGISGVGNFIGRFPGVLGNSLKVSVCGSANAFTSTLSGNVTATNGSKTVTGVATGANGAGVSATAFSSEIRAGDILVLGPDQELRRVASVSNNSVLTLEEKYTGNTTNAFLSNANHNASAATVERRWEYHNFFDAAPGTSAFANTAGGANDELHAVVVDEDGEWTGSKNVVLERYSNLSKASNAKGEDGSTTFYKNVINQRSQYIFWAAHDTGHTGVGSVASTSFSGRPLPTTDSLIYGRDGGAPRDTDYIKGYNLFKNKDEVDVSILINGGRNSTVTEHNIGNIVEVRRDCVLTVSPERADVVNNASHAGKEVNDIIAFRNSLSSSSFVVMDSGWKFQFDKFNDVNIYVPGNADTAGCMVRTDLNRDSWFSPAGFNRGQFKNIIKLAFNPNKAERDLLYKNGVNPITTFPGQGTVLFGDKTLLTKPSAFDRINVRRLFITLEKAISTAAKFTLFEFNDAFTRSQFINLVEPFLRDVQARRGCQDFRVVCDETNNTAEVIDRNEFRGDIFIKPNRSINFIQLNFVAVRSGVEFNEIVGQSLNQPL
jgi:hypothetical protein